MSAERDTTVEMLLDDFARQILDSLPVAVMIESPDTEILYSNPAATAVFGWRPEEVVGRRGLDVGIATTDQQVALEILSSLVAGRPWSGEFPMRNRSGQSLIVKVTAAPLLRDGETVAIVVTSADVTQRRLVNETFGLLDSLMTSAPVGLAFFDTEMRYVKINRALAEINGLAPEAHIGRRISDVLPDLGMQITDVLHQVLATNQPVIDLEVTGATPSRPEEQRTWLSSWYPLQGTAGKPVGVGLVVLDITDRKREEAERERLFQAERAAREVAEVAQGRLALLAEAGTRLASSLDPETTLANVARLVVPRMANICVVDLLEGDGLRRAAVVVAHEERQGRTAAFLSARSPQPDGSNPVADVLRTGTPLVISAVREEHVHGPADGPTRAEVIGRLADRSAMIVPLVTRGEVLGTLSLTSCPGAPPYGDEDLTLAKEIARRAAVAIDNARLYAAERHIADTLQRSLLPPPPLVAPGVDVAVRYMSAEVEGLVGGDFYDLVLVEDRPWTTAVGDVAGKGVRAAAVMGQLRAAIRAYALEGHEPADIVRRLDRLFRTMDASDFTTCVLASYEPTTRVLTWSNAGHLPALVRRADGRCEWLRGPTALPLGLGDPDWCGQEKLRLSSGDLFLLYTDGLVERRTESIDVGLARLCKASAEAPTEPEAFCDQVVKALLGDDRRDDDVALLAFRAD